MLFPRCAALRLAQEGKTSFVVMWLYLNFVASEDVAHMAGKTAIELPPLLSNNSASNNSSPPRQSSLRSIYETVNEITSTGDRSPPNPHFTPEIHSPPVPDNSGTLRGGQHQHYPAFSTSQLKNGADFDDK